MARMKALLDEVQILLECGYSVSEISEALCIDYETAEAAVEFWTDYAE